MCVGGVGHLGGGGVSRWKIWDLGCKRITGRNDQGDIFRCG